MVFPMFREFIWFLFLLFSVCSVQSKQTTDEAIEENLKMIRAHLKKINKPGIKTIKSPDGDIIDCVLSHQQLAFDHPLLKGQKPMDPPEIPRGYNNLSSVRNEEVFQVWHMSGESCPEGSVPVRRVTEEDILGFQNISTFGTKSIIPNDSPTKRHEYAGATVEGNTYYGTQASINVWAPRVQQNDEFSLSQIWVSAGTDGVDQLNTIEAGWQVYPQLFNGDRQPRLFIYWTRDNYKGTGCYNLLCPGFVQKSNRVGPGAAITPVSSYGGPQLEITLLIFKDHASGDWWLHFNGEFVGYWPNAIFTHLKDHATVLQFGGEIVNRGGDGSHTSTQMGSGHFAEEGDSKASYFRDIKMSNDPANSNLLPPQNIQISADHPNCYDVKQGNSKNHFNYGGPGKNPKCL